MTDSTTPTYEVADLAADRASLRRQRRERVKRKLREAELAWAERLASCAGISR